MKRHRRGKQRRADGAFLGLARPQQQGALLGGFRRLGLAGEEQRDACQHEGGGDAQRRREEHGADHVESDLSGQPSFFRVLHGASVGSGFRGMLETD